MEEGTSGSRRTRSQVAPEWTIKESLILVNEIAAVESECSNALSSFQKWEIISENCNALDVHRTLNQCRRKWDVLLSDYKQVIQWESQAGKSCSYWSLSNESRKRHKLPGEFCTDLFEAIKAIMMLHEDKAGTEPDSDPEAQDTLNAITELGHKRSRQRVMVVEEKQREKNKKKTRKEVKVGTEITKEKAQEQQGRQPVKDKLGEKEEEDEETMVMKLSEKVDLVHAIVAGNETGGGSKDDDDDEMRMKLVRRQGDQLISCLVEIVKTLDRFRGFVGLN